MSKFSDEEKAILEALYSGELKKSDDPTQAILKAEQMAKEHLKSKTRVNVRISHEDLIKIKSMAEEEGIPYQTFLSSIVHKVATGKITW